MTNTTRTLVLVACGVGVLSGIAGGGAGYFRGIDEAEQRFSMEINALRQVEDSVARYYQRTGRYPSPTAGHYRMDGLAVSTASDTMVSYYSGVDAEHLLILHLNPAGRITLSRR